MKLEGCVQSDVQNTSCKTANLIIPEGTDVNDSKQMKRHRLYLHLKVGNHLMEGEFLVFFLEMNATWGSQWPQPIPSLPSSNSLAFNCSTSLVPKGSLWFPTFGSHNCQANHTGRGRERDGLQRQSWTEAKTVAASNLATMQTQNKQQNKDREMFLEMNSQWKTIMQSTRTTRSVRLSFSPSS